MPLDTMPDVQGLPPALTMRDVQDYLGISRPKTYELAHTRGFPVVRFGRTIRVPRDAFLRWIDEKAGIEGEGR
jgi:excisionase family DNA binding protein